MAQRLLIVHADDLGADEARNEGIFEAVDAGVVTAVSLLPNGSALEDAVEGLRARTDMPLSVGLHLNLTEGKPVAQGLRRLVGPDGCFPGKPAVFSLLGREDDSALVEEIDRELMAQANLLAGLGVAVDHLDGHRHCHIFPAVLQKAVALAGRCGIRWFRLPREERLAGSTQVPEVLEAEAALFHRLAVAALPVVRASTLGVTDAFRGLYLRGRFDAINLGAVVASLPEGLTELMVHPGKSPPGKRTGPFAAFSNQEREMELQTLLSPTFRNTLLAGGVVLTPFPS